MFQLADGSVGAEQDISLRPLAPSTGGALEEEFETFRPLDTGGQMVLFRRLAGARIARFYLGRSASVADLERRADALLAAVTKREPWSITRLADVAVGRASLPSWLIGKPDAERSELLASIVALELLRPYRLDGLDVMYSTLVSEAVLSNLRLVGHEARRFAKGGFLSFGDLFQDGVLGLMHGVEKYDPYRGFAFSTYATHWIRSYIMRALADHDRTIRLPVHVVDRLNAVLRAARDREALRLAAGDAGDNPEQSTERAESDQVLRWARPPLPLRIGIACYGEDEDIDAAMDAVEWQLTLATVVNELPHAERQVLSLRFGLVDGLERTLAEVGAVVHLTRERVRQIEQRALTQLRADLVLDDRAFNPRTKRPYAGRAIAPRRRRRGRGDLRRGGAAVLGPHQGQRSAREEPPRSHDQSVWPPDTGWTPIPLNLSAAERRGLTQSLGQQLVDWHHAHPEQESTAVDE
jgi:RNA polymerase sigma factor (sigma-70 family)